MRIVRYLKNSKIAVALIVCLLIVQAFTDLALPNYTSQIVDVGIQQSGVEHAATEEMTARTHDLVAMMLPEGDEKTFEAAYDETDQGTYKLNAQGEREQAELDRMVSLPLVAIHYSHQIPDLDLDQALQAYQAGAVQKQQILDMLDKAKEQMGDMGDSIVDQQAIAAARAEYEQLGYNLSDMQMRYLVRIGLTMLGLAALGMAVAILVGFIASRTAAKVGATLRAKLFRQVVSFSDAEVQSFSAASLITRGTNDIQLVQMVTVMLLRMVLYAPILAIGGIIMVSRTNLAMSWIIVLAVVVIGVLIVVLMKVAMPKFKIMQKLIDRVNLVSREILTGLPVIRAFDRQPFEEQRFDVASTRLMKTQLFTNRVMTFMMPLMMLIMNGVSVLIVWVGGSYIDNGTIQTGDLIAFITYAMVIIMGFLMIGMISIMLPRADVAAQRVDEVLSKQPTICDPAPGKARDAELAGRTGGARIVFDDVSFKYGDSAECVLENLDFACEPGQTTAIIGSTGSGKSTVVKLIERFYDVTERLHHRGRRGRARREPGGSARAAGLRAAEGVFVQRHHPVEHRVLGRGHARGARGAGGPGGPGRRLHRLEGRGARRRGVAGRHERVGRPAPAPGHRPRAGHGGPRVPLRRQLLGARLQDRRGAAPGAAHAPGRQDGGHRGPAHLHHPARRQDRRARRRPDRRPWAPTTSS